MGGGGSNKEGCRPRARAHTGVEEERAWAAAAATRKVSGPATTAGEEEELVASKKRRSNVIPRNVPTKSRISTGTDLLDR